jgi:hypothetical protein
MSAALASLLAGSASAFLAASPADAATSKCISVGTSTTRCYYMDGYVKSSKWVVFSDSMENDTNRTGTFSCTADVSKTDSFKVTVSVTVGVEAFLVAKAEATVGGELQSSVTSGYSSTGGISVPGNTITLCDRGVARDNFKGHYTSTNCSSQACSAPTTTKFTMTGPVKARWWFSDIKIGS